MINTDNIITATDSYKMGHWNQYPKGTEGVYSYLESRNGSVFPYTVFFGLQYIINRYLVGVRVTREAIEEAAELAEAHFGNDTNFNRAGWEYILEKHDGKLPVRIKAVKEGSVIPTSNVLMTVENTDPECYWLTNALESILTHVWYSSNVATLSRLTKEMIAEYLDTSADSRDALPFMLHDFGYRGATTHEAAGIGGAGHLLNFLGTDTVPALQFARKYYDAELEGLGLSVVATEHSVMTSRGPEGEPEVIEELLDNNPTGIVSCVGDSYDIYNFVTNYVCGRFKKRIQERDGVFVTRPDSDTKRHPEPADQVVWILQELWKHFGGTTNSKGYKVLDSHVRVLWGDGIGYDGIKKILKVVTDAGFSAENLVFGMGGGLLQKHNRDSQRFAFKSSAQKRDGQWFDVFKKPLDLSKASKKGRLSLIEYEGKLITLEGQSHKDDILETVFENGELVNPQTFAEARENANLPVPVTA